MFANICAYAALDSAESHTNSWPNPEVRHRDGKQRASVLQVANNQRQHVTGAPGLTLGGDTSMMILIVCVCLRVCVCLFVCIAVCSIACSCADNSSLLVLINPHPSLTFQGGGTGNLPTAISFRSLSFSHLHARVRFITRSVSTLLAQFFLHSVKNCNCISLPLPLPRVLFLFLFLALSFSAGFLVLTLVLSGGALETLFCVGYKPTGGVVRQSISNLLRTQVVAGSRTHTFSCICHIHQIAQTYISMGKTHVYMYVRARQSVRVHTHSHKTPTHLHTHTHTHTHTPTHFVVFA